MRTRTPSHSSDYCCQRQQGTDTQTHRDAFLAICVKPPLPLCVCGHTACWQRVCLTVLSAGVDLHLSAKTLTPTSCFSLRLFSNCCLVVSPPLHNICFVQPSTQQFESSQPKEMVLFLFGFPCRSGVHFISVLCINTVELGAVT